MGSNRGLSPGPRNYKASALKLSYFSPRDVSGYFGYTDNLLLLIQEIETFRSEKENLKNHQIMNIVPYTVYEKILLLFF